MTIQNKDLKISQVLIILFLVVGLGFAVFFKEQIHVPKTYLLIWAGCVCYGMIYIHKHIVLETKLIALIFLILATALSGVNLFITPEVSRKASGHSFVKAAEATIPQNMKIVIYKINQDGDGVKYAFYSSRKPTSLQFITTPNKLRTLTPPYLLIMQDSKTNHQQLEHLFKPENIIIQATGTIRSHQFIALQIK